MPGDFMQRGANIAFLIANNLHLDVRRQLGLYAIELLLGVVNHLNRVGA